ncbi:hypothetical protein M409DRAFT_26025 [Zasmidium cellare ATCC 36951]|uniref:Xaa-Pro dipeptidyl-peptidase C-terminal domain-containing protein n=1 Tax=Zasmidium cellare ATCC 36951 TaxID=1080233 RepID=A0A6A6CCJ4_ZASCE|nr:uncharacterized protein M409DRAFT_26025 [Zasmidium cellare ATCC 36951]KAF2163409.1 hypothetical protein M409DRAFT_26025 [Zasmidium cellare ATCC 36951]
MRGSCTWQYPGLYVLGQHAGREVSANSCGDHINAYYGKDAVARQRRFLDHFLRDDIAAGLGGLKDLPKIDLTIRREAALYWRAEKDFPPLETQYREYFLNADGGLGDGQLDATSTGVVAHACGPPSKGYDIKVPIQPTSMIFEKGHKIQIEIGARDSDTLLGVMRQEGGDRTDEKFAGVNTIFHGSKLVLPFVLRT